MTGVGDVDAKVVGESAERPPSRLAAIEDVENLVDPVGGQRRVECGGESGRLLGVDSVDQGLECLAAVGLRGEALEKKVAELLAN